MKLSVLQSTIEGHKVKNFFRMGIFKNFITEIDVNR